MNGRALTGNETSTTEPLTRDTRPVAAVVSCVRFPIVVIIFSALDAIEAPGSRSGKAPGMKRCGACGEQIL
jgi:hypothetical protein